MSNDPDAIKERAAAAAAKREAWYDGRGVARTVATTPGPAPGPVPKGTVDGLSDPNYRPWEQR